MNEEVSFTLDEAVQEVLGLLTGLDLMYRPELDRYRSITRQLNRALRAVALDNEWSYYASTLSLGLSVEGQICYRLQSSKRPRIIGDDAIRLCDEDGIPVAWAYFLPRDALHKYRNKSGLWAAHVRQEIVFSRPFTYREAGLTIEIPVMREPVMFRLPEQPEDPNAPTVTVPVDVREQPVDFDFPDLVIRRAAYFYAQTDPILQPRVQTLEAQYKEAMYALTERDTRNTDTPYQNEWSLGIESGIRSSNHRHGAHPHADYDRLW